MNMHVYILVYYAIIKMAAEKHLTSGKNFYDILGRVNYLFILGLTPMILCSVLSHIELYFFALWHRAVSDYERHQ